MTGSTETLDKFYGWGQLLLSDFDDIDKNMADADRVLANLRDLHELDDLSYLTDEQREMLQRFFSNFTDDHPSALKERFLHLWSRMADIYHDFRQRLASQGLAYEGMLYRQVVESLTIDSHSAAADATVFPYDTYLFVGFNLLQQVEQRLFSLLQKEERRVSIGISTTTMLPQKPVSTSAVTSKPFQTNSIQTVPTSTTTYAVPNTSASYRHLPRISRHATSAHGFSSKNV